MSNVLESLKKQLEALKVEMEEAKAHVYRCDGATRTLEHLITEFAEAEKPATPSEDEKPAEA